MAVSSAGEDVRSSCAVEVSISDGDIGWLGDAGDRKVAHASRTMSRSMVVVAGTAIRNLVSVLDHLAALFILGELGCLFGEVHRGSLHLMIGILIPRDHDIVCEQLALIILSAWADTSV